MRLQRHYSAASSLACWPRVAIASIAFWEGRAVRSYLTATAYAIVLTGCADIPTVSTGIQPAGPNTYTLSERFRPMLGSVEAEQRSTLAKADNFCSQQGRKSVPSTMEPGDPGPFGPTVFTVVFQCLLPNDPAVAKYQSEQMPDVTVEQRNR